MRLLSEVTFHIFALTLDSCNGLMLAFSFLLDRMQLWLKPDYLIAAQQFRQSSEHGLDQESSLEIDAAVLYIPLRVLEA